MSLNFQFTNNPNNPFPKYKLKPLYLENLSILKPELSFRSKINNNFRFIKDFHHIMNFPNSNNNVNPLIKLKLSDNIFSKRHHKLKHLELKHSTHYMTTKSKETPRQIQSQGKYIRYLPKETNKGIKIEKSRSVVNILENKFIKGKILEKERDRSVTKIDIKFDDSYIKNHYYYYKYRRNNHNNNLHIGNNTFNNYQSKSDIINYYRYKFSRNVHNNITQLSK